MTIKNRGALSNPEGRFENQLHEEFNDGWDLAEEELPVLQTLLYSFIKTPLLNYLSSLTEIFTQINPFA